MNSQQREQLLGYLLGALDDDERLAVESQLDNDPSLQAELEELKRSLSPLAVDFDDEEPPSDLTRRTCSYVARESRIVPVELAPECEQPMRLRDLLVASTVLAAALLIIFPAVSQSRFNAEVARCGDNLRQLGFALARFSDDHGGYFPEGPTEGPLSVAGSFAPQLIGKGLLEDVHFLRCPGADSDRRVPFGIPTLQDVVAADREQRQLLVEQLGGDYGYRLGYVENDIYMPLRNLRREHAVIMADSPNRRLDGSPATHHGNRGQNYLFEGGGVKFLQHCRVAGDDWYLNEDRQVAPGRHRNDTVIAPSNAPRMIIIIRNF